MAFVQFDFYSKILDLETSMNVILPQQRSEEEVQDDLSNLDYIMPEKNFPVLYLLHGLSDSHSAWMRKTAIERYASEKGLAVVMPAVHRSFYTDMKQGYPYWTFISREVPLIARRYFPLSQKRTDNFVAGLSMGGFGAFKIALNRPEKFSAAASLSGALDLIQLIKNEEGEMNEEFKMIFGDLENIKNSRNDLCSILKSGRVNAADYPDLYQCCGQDDFLYENNLQFKKAALESDINLTYEEDAGEEHTWSYWDNKIQRVLDWLPVNAEL